MNCNKCGAPNPDDALYCSICGSKMETEVPVYPTNNYSNYVVPPQYSNDGLPGDPTKNWAAVASVCCSGAAFLCCGVPLSIVGLIFGIIGLKSRQRKLSILGIVISAVAFIVTLILVVTLYQSPEYKELLDSLMSQF